MRPRAINKIILKKNASSSLEEYTITRLNSAQNVKEMDQLNYFTNAVRQERSYILWMERTETAVFETIILKNTAFEVISFNQNY